MRFWNINGFYGAAADVVRFLSDEPCDVLVLIDSQLTDAEMVHRTLPGWKLLHESRPHNTHKQRLFGGITVLWRKENVRVCREGGYPKGVLSFVVQDAAGRHRPVAIVALYSPPLTSRLNREGKQWSVDILDWAALEQARLCAKYGFVIVGGDFNWRIFSAFRRRTEDCGRDDGGCRTAVARRWHLQTGLRPLYGQRGQLRGSCTSRTENGYAEVDGISVCGRMPAGWAARALKIPEWEEYSTRGGVHRPVGIAIFAPRLSLASDEHRAENDADKGTTGRAANPPVRAIAPLPYGSAQYHTMSKAVADCVIKAATQLEQGSVDATGALDAIVQGLLCIQAENYADGMQNARGRRPHKVSSVTTLRGRRPHRPFRRLASGINVPPAMVALYETKRRHMADIRRAKLKLRRAGSKLSASERASIHQSIARSKSESARVMREAGKRLQSHEREQCEAEAQRVAHLAVSNPKRFHRVVRNKVPEQYGVFDESAGPSVEKCVAFRDFFAKLLSRVRHDAGNDRTPAEVVRDFADSIPQTSASTNDMLTATVIWQEVYALLYPAHKLATRDIPCLPTCRLCPLFADHVEAFEPGDTSMTPPEHRPRLWTSKAAGPDGVFAETLRWACPEARTDRHAYRKAISVALASIFNAIIASRQVPMSSLFADSVMTALYKGVGDRDDPTNYRGICVPNVLAKLFGLVLGTRLSHWAVANGVISPAQAGFVVMHGCEYHIYTLLETLRHRVRQGQDTILVFLDFKKAYDSVPQPLAWEVLKRMSIPDDFISLLKSWTSQSQISLRMGGTTLEPFPQETGVPQGGVLSPIIFNLFIETLIRYVNAHAADLGVELSADDAKKAGSAGLPEALRLLALAYADDVVLICPDMESAQAALRLVEAWAAAFGMTLGIGNAKSMAMLISADTVVQACKNDVNGMLKRNAKTSSCAHGSEADPVVLAEDPDDDHATVLDDDDEEWLPDGDPIEVPLKSKRGSSVKGDGARGECRGRGKRKPRTYTPRPLPPLPNLTPLHVTVRETSDSDPVDVDIPWTSLYKYLGFMLRADLLDDHAYARVEKKTRAAAERLFPHHRLVRAWALGLKLQTLQTLVLSITANVLPLLTSMRCASESKTSRLDQLRKEIARATLRLKGTPRHAYVTAEAGLGDVLGDITQHRVRLSHALSLHPLRTLAAPPIACRVQEIMAKEAEYFNKPGQHKHSLLLAPWSVITDRIVTDAVQLCASEGWSEPELHREVAPYASLVARVGERKRWITRMQEDIDWMCDSFACRPPHGARRQTAALHWTSRLRYTDAGPHSKLTPLSYRGPRGSPIVALSRRRSRLTSVISSMRQGEASMEHFPFTDSQRMTTKARQTAAKPNYGRSWKVCHLCAADGAQSRYDLWHVLFECRVTRDTKVMVDVRESCKAFLPKLCDAIEMAVAKNGESMSNTINAGVSHRDILDASWMVRDALLEYDWECVPGCWLIYALLLALPFPAVAVRPDPVSPVWLCPMKRKRKGVVPPRNLHGMPRAVPTLPDVQYSLPEAVGRLFDSTILSTDALRPLADDWCRLSEGNLLRAGALIRPLREAANVQRVIEGNIDVDGGEESLEDGDAVTESGFSSSGSEPDAEM